MEPRPPLSVVIITLNEEQNLPRCLESVRWAEEVLVVDSGSKDRTREIAEKAGARVLEHPWEGYGQQKNFANSQAKNDWILSLDADEELTTELRAEIEDFLARRGRMHGNLYWGAAFPRLTSYLGRWIRYGGWYPNRLVRLAHRGHARWTETPVHESWEVDSQVWPMQADLLHYTFRDVFDQVTTNVRFARLGARTALARGERPSLWRIFLKPPVKFLETYVWKRGFLDGFAGFVISVNAAHSIFMKYVGLYCEKNPGRK